MFYKSFFEFNRPSLELVLQQESMECGLACVVMIANYYGANWDLFEVRERFPGSSQGVSIKSLTEIAEEFSLTPRVLSLDLVDLKKLRVPCILHWGMDHFVVLKEMKKNVAVIFDPATGKEFSSLKVLNEKFTGIAIEFSPNIDFEQNSGQSKRPNIWALKKHLAGFNLNAFQVVLISFFIQACLLATPFFLQSITDDIVIKGNIQILDYLLLAFVFIVIFHAASEHLRSEIITFLSARFGFQLTTKLFDLLIKLPVDFFEKRHAGDILSKFHSAEQIRNTVTDSFISSLVDSIMVFITIIAMMLINPKLTLIVLIFTSIYCLYNYLNFNKNKRLNVDKLKAEARCNQHLIETVGAVPSIKIYQKEKQRLFMWQNKLVNLINKDLQLNALRNSLSTLKFIIFGIENIVVLYIGTKLTMEGEISLGLLLAFIAYKLRFIDSFEKFLRQFTEMKLIKVHIDRISDVIYGKQEAHESIQLLPCNHSPSFAGRINIINLGFRYGASNSWVFRNLNFTVEPGEFLAITGPSGIGKSTLLKCLTGLKTPVEGEILIDGKPLNIHKNYRRSISTVFQDDSLLSGSILENIAFFEAAPDLMKIKHCAKLACIDDEINALPMGYFTQIGGGSASLSGGQKQRVLLARALFKDPKILFLDEASSHLDLANEEKINSNIKQLDITRIVIAHRKETLRFADRVICL